MVYLSVKIQGLLLRAGQLAVVGGGHGFGVDFPKGLVGFLGVGVCQRTGISGFHLGDGVSQARGGASDGVGAAFVRDGEVVLLHWFDLSMGAIHERIAWVILVSCSHGLSH